MCSRRRPQQVMRGVDVGDPVPQRFVDGVLQGPAAARHGYDLGAEHPHPGHVEGLPFGVDLAHVDDAVEPEVGARGRCGHAVLAGPGLGDHPLLAHPGREQSLPEDVADLVGTCVVQVLALEQDAGADALGQPFGLVEQARAAGVLAQQPGELVGERLVAHRVAPVLLQLVERGDERLGHEPAAETAEVPGGVGQRACHGQCLCFSAGWVPAATRSDTADRGSLPVTSDSPTKTTSAPSRAYSSTS